MEFARYVVEVVAKNVRICQGNDGTLVPLYFGTNGVATSLEAYQNARMVGVGFQLAAQIPHMIAHQCRVTLPRRVVPDLLKQFL